MVTFRDTMDQHSVDVLRGEKLVAMLQWHPGREPRFVIPPSGVDFPEFTIAEVRAMTEHLNKRIAGWVRAETDRAMRPILGAFVDPSEKRWPIAGSGSVPAGSVGDAEARLAYSAYMRSIGGDGENFSGFREGGFHFNYGGLVSYLGYEPTTWTPLAAAAVEERRWPVQGDRAYSEKDSLDGVARAQKPAGTVGDAEARTAYASYAQKYGTVQTFETFERLHDRGGFGYWDLTSFLGHEPTTWAPLAATEEKRWPVQGERAYGSRDTSDGVARPAKPPGTVGEAEAREAFAAYDKKYPGQTFEYFHGRGGFAYYELVQFLGREPTTWRVR